MTVALSSLRVEADLPGAQRFAGDAAGVAQGLDKVGAAAAGAARGVETTERVLAAGAGSFERLRRSLDSSYEAQARFEAGQTRIQRQFEQGRISLADSERLLGLLKRRYDDQVAAIDRATEAQRRNALQVAAARAEQQALLQASWSSQGQAIANRFAGVNDNRTDTAARMADFEAAARAADQLRARYVPLVAEQQRYLLSLREIREAQAAGILTQAQAAAAIERTKVNFAAQVASINASKTAAETHTGAVKLQAHQIANLGQQIQDVGVQLAGGQNPFLILAQQGPQAAYAVGGFANLAKLALSFVTPLNVALGALAVTGGIVTLRALDLSSETRAAGVAIRAMGRDADFTTGRFNALVERMRDLGVSKDDARAALTAGLRNPLAGSADLQRAATLAPDFAAGFGTDISTATKALIELGTGGYAAIKKLDEAYNFLEPEQLRQIRLLSEQGRQAEATALAYQVLGDRIRGLANDSMSGGGQAWLNFKRGFEDASTWAANLSLVAFSVTQLGKAMSELANNNYLKAIGELPLFKWMANGFGFSSSAGAGAGASGPSAVSVLLADIARIETALKDAKLPGQRMGLETALAVARRKYTDMSVAAVAGEGGSYGPPAALQAAEAGGYTSSGAQKAAVSYVNDITDAYKRQLPVLQAAANARDVMRAKIAAEIEATQKGAVGKEREAIIALRVREVTDQQAVSYRDATAGLNLQIDGLGRVAEAYAISEAAGKQAEARLQAEQEHRTNASVSIEGQTRRLILLAQAQDRIAAARQGRDLDQQASGLRLVAEAYSISEAAGRAMEIQVRAEADASANAEINAAKHAQRLQEVAAAQDRIAGSKAVADMRLQADAAQRLTVAARGGAEASQEAQRLLEVEAFERQRVAAAGDVMTDKIREMVAAYDAESARRLRAQQDLQRETALRNAGREATLAAAQAQAAAISNPAERRAAELAIERQRELNRLSDQYGDLMSRQAQQELAFWDAAAQSREMTRFWDDVRAKGEELSKDLTSFLVDGFVNAQAGGKSMFDNLWSAATAGMKRFFASMIAEAARVNFVQPIANGVVSQFSRAFGIVSPGGSPAGSSGLAMGFGPLAGLGNMGGLGADNFAGQTPGSYGPFAPNAANSFSPLGALGAALAAAGAGYGLQQATGSKALGALGGAGTGALTGYMLAGPWGAAAGGLAGLLGGLFGNTSKSVGPNSGAYGYFTSTGSLTGIGSGADNGGSTGGVLDLLNKTSTALQTLATATGATINSGVSVSYGSFASGIQAGVYDPTTRQYLGGLGPGTGVGQDAEAAATRVVRAILGEGSAGISAEIKLALANSKATTLEGLGSDVEFARSFEASIRSLTAGVADLAANAETAARDEVAALTASLVEFKRRTRELGLDITGADTAAQEAVKVYLGLKDSSQAASRAEAELAALRGKSAAAADLLKAVGLDPALAALVEANGIAALIKTANDNVAAELRAMTDPLGAQLDQLEAQRREAVEYAAKIGADVNLVEQLYGAKRVQLVEQANAAIIASTKSANEAITAYLYGNAVTDPSLTAAQRFTAAQGQFAETLTLARAGDTDARGRAAQAAEQLRAAAADQYGTATLDYATVRDLIRSQLTQLLDVPGYASGTPYAPGGWSLLGEQGPEYAYIPRGTTVLPAHVSANLMAGGGADMSQVTALLTQILAMQRETAAQVAGLKQARLEANRDNQAARDRLENAELARRRA
ncbi:MAG: phage tail length tape measure family protein [Ferrovibrio sp.]|nr:phage tail length tape measure family protein [Ferrovibrio sp.]